MTEHDHAAHIHPGHDLLAVFPDDTAATEARQRLAGSGVPDEAIVVGDPRDRVAAVTAESRAEFGGGGGVVTWSRTRHGQAPPLLTVAGVAWVAVLVVGLVIALIPFAHSYWERYLIVIAAGLTMASMVSILATIAMGADHSSLPLASERGVTMHVHDATDDACQRLLELHPMRLDEITPDGYPTPGVHVAAGMRQVRVGHHDSTW